jgi:hypothetical protein
MSEEKSTTPDPDERLPGGLTRAQFLELHETNPIAAARYSREHGVYLSNSAFETPARAIMNAQRQETPEEMAERVRAALSWHRRPRNA